MCFNIVKSKLLKSIEQSNQHSKKQVQLNWPYEKVIFNTVQIFEALFPSKSLSAVDAGCQIMNLLVVPQEEAGSQAADARLLLIERSKASAEDPPIKPKIGP